MSPKNSSAHIEQKILASLDRQTRRATGIYFSGSTWADLLWNNLPKGDYQRYVDPACGIGDLLLAAARRLDLCDTHAETVASWATKLSGTDISPIFVQAAWDRIAALSLERHSDDFSQPGQLRFTIPGAFRACDSLTYNWEMRSHDCVLMNPPFHQVDSPAWSRLFKGKVTAAALFLEKALYSAPKGCTVASIVPEVIRSGSRFRKLREAIEKNCSIVNLKAAGRFSKEADIDVSIAVFRIGSASKRRTKLPAFKHEVTLGDLCDIRVGAVVPHRPQFQPTPTRYVDAKGAPVGATIEVLRTEQYRATAFDPPFVIVRRTSGPSDRKRARGTVIRKPGPVQVENHLIVLLPRRRTLEECQRILKSLSDDRTDTWLNNELRCRHLTVGAVSNIPLWPTV